MTDSDNQPPPDRPIALDYGHPAKPKLISLWFVGGIVVAGLLWGTIGFVVGFNMTVPYRGPIPKQSTIRYTDFFLCLSVAAIVTLIAVRRSRRLFILGFLLATAVVGLLQGFCFMKM